jgi:hypothetical protein
MTGHPTAYGEQTSIAQAIAITITVLQQATTVTTILTEGLAVFQIIRQLARSCEDHAPDLFAAFLSAAGAATEGCELLMLAVSSPPANPSAPITVPPGADAEEIADSLTVLAAVLAGRLAMAAAIATVPGDRDACQNAAAAALTVRHLLTGPGHEPGPR